MTGEPPSAPSSPTRTIVRADVLEWLAANPLDARHAVAASMPDYSELPERAVAPWKAWFTRVAEAIFAAAHPDCPVVFFQSDVRHAGAWIDKGFLVQQAAERAGATLLLHRVVCRRPAGTITAGRATWSHLLDHVHRQGLGRDLDASHDALDHTDDGVAHG